MKISQLRGLLGQLQLRHGDVDVFDTTGNSIGGAICAGPDHPAKAAILLLPQHAPGERRSEAQDDDQ